jgi:hypothetical protein
MIKFIYYVIPVPIFFTNFGVPKNSGGCFRGGLIFIRPKYKNDKGLLFHEIEHAKQFWKYGLIFFSLSYLLSKKFRLNREVEAYKVQLKHDPHAANAFARFIATKYNLDISQNEALELLIK